MREIKFRIWDGLKMWYPETKTSDNSFTNLIIFNNPDSIKFGIYDSIYNIRYCSGEYHDLMQYTGLKDKNGKETYEGDIIKIKDFLLSNLEYDFPNDDPKETYKDLTTVVYFKDGSFCFDIDSDLSAIPLSGFDNFEIIGNIHQNSELL
jgi:uncharacterized phage protein (TIGR01671 family)